MKMILGSRGRRRRLRRERGIGFLVGLTVVVKIGLTLISACSIEHSMILLRHMSAGPVRSECDVESRRGGLGVREELGSGKTILLGMEMGGAEDYGPPDDGEEQFDMAVNEVRVNLEPRARSPRPHGPAPPRDPPAPTQRPRSPGPGEPGYWPAHGVGDHTGAAQQYLDLRLPSTNENVECVICMESLAGAAHLLAGAECLHAFHEECLKAWLRTAPVPGCPTCRREYIPGPPREVAQHRAPQPAQRRGAQAQAPARTAPPASANGHRTDAQALQRLGFRIEAELDPAAIAARQARAEGERRRRARQGVPLAGRRGR